MVVLFGCDSKAYKMPSIEEKIEDARFYNFTFLITVYHEAVRTKHSDSSGVLEQFSYYGEDFHNQDLRIDHLTFTDTEFEVLAEPNLEKIVCSPTKMDLIYTEILLNVSPQNNSNRKSELPKIKKLPDNEWVTCVIELDMSRLGGDKYMVGTQNYTNLTNLILSP